MRQRLSILLIVAYAACQAAAMPHAHGSETAHSVASVPAALSIDAHEHHHHPHSGHAHVHTRPAASLPENPPATPAEHDSDAVYMPDVVVDRTDGSAALQFTVIGWFIALPADGETLEAAAAQGPQAGVLAACPPPQEHCALFLKLCTLRI